MRSNSGPFYRHAAVVAAVTAVLFVAVSLAAASGATDRLDLYAEELAAAWHSDLLWQAAYLASLAGTATGLIGAALVAAVLAARRGNTREAVLPFLPLLVAWVANSLLKSIFERTRPTDEFWPPGIFGADQYSFPSGHAMNSMALFSLLAWWTWAWWPERGRLVATLLVMLAPVAIGLSRVVLGVHWLSDVVGGWLAGAVITSLILLVWVRTGGQKAS